MTEELKPCPHCGPGGSVVSVYFDDNSRRYRVGCGACGCATGIHPRDKTPAPAIAAWNRREPAVTDDTRLMDFLASREQNIANVMLPHEIVIANLGGGLRAMIAATMAEWERSKPCTHKGCGTPKTPGPCAFDGCPRNS